MKDYIGEIDASLLENTILDPGQPEQLRDVHDVAKIIVHHEAVDEQYDYDDITRYESEAEYQNNTSIPGSKGLQYHFKIDNVGQIFQIRPFNIITWHAGNLGINNHSIAVCLDGNFDDQEPTLEQIESLKQLLDWLSTQHPEFPASQGDVYCHSEVIDKSYFPGGTACCGKNLEPYVVDYRNSGGNPVTPNVHYQHPELQPMPTDPTPPPAPADPVILPPVADQPPEPATPPATVPIRITQVPPVVDPQPSSPISPGAPTTTSPVAIAAPKPGYKTSELYVAVAAFLTPYINQFGHLNFTTPQIALVVGAASVYVWGRSTVKGKSFYLEVYQLLQDVGVIK